MKKTLIIIFVSIITMNVFAQSESRIDAMYFNDVTLVGYNFFVGADAKEFTTVPKVLGSGVYDFSYNYSIPIWLIKPDKRLIGVALPIGLRIAKYRFLDNLSVENNNGTYQFSENTDPTHSYNNSFFSYEGSKLVTGYWRVPILVYMPVQKWLGGDKDNFGIFGSFFYERRAFSYHKLKYKVDGNKQKIFTGNKKFNDFGFTKNRIGVSGGIKISKIVFFAQYLITPFFDDSVGKKINEMRVGLNFVPPKKKSNNSTPFRNYEL